MFCFTERISKSFHLIFTLDAYLLEIIFLSLQISFAAITIATIFAVPLGIYLGLKPLQQIRFVSNLLYTFMGLPPVVAGLVVYLFLSRQGPLGVLELLYTPAAMIIAQVVLALPIIAGFTMIGVREKGQEVAATARTLGAGVFLVVWTVLRESRFLVLGAIISGLGRIIAEVGAVMIVGGNIAGHTRVMTTAVVLEIRQGNFEQALGLGIVLLGISFILNYLLYYFQERGRSNVQK